MSAAVEHAFRILGWRDNLMEEEMPPKWMWHIEDELAIWFDEVDRKRKEKYGGGSDDDQSELMMTNEYARELRASQ